MALVLLLGGCPKRGGPSSTRQSGVRYGHGLPEDVAPVVEALAASTDPVVRGAALTLAMTASPSPGGGPPAAAALWDPSPWVQGRAVEVLMVRLAEREAQEALLAYAGRPEVSPHVACPALQEAARGALAEEPARAVVQSRLDTERRPWLRLPCLLAAAGLAEGSSSAVVPELGAILEEGGLPLDARFVRHLLRTAPAALDETLGQLPELVEDVLILPVVLGLLERGHPAGLRHAQALARADDVELALGLALGLAELDGDAVPGLLQQLSGHSDALVAETAALLLGVRGAGAAGSLSRALESEELELRLLALELLGELVCEARESGGTRPLERLSTEALETAWASERTQERIAAVALLGRLGSPRDRDRAAALLTDESPELQLAAAEAVLSLESGAGS